MPSASARLRACSMDSGERSIPVTSQKRRAAEMAVLPEPVATSRTPSPERRATASQRRAPRSARGVRGRGGSRAGPPGGGGGVAGAGGSVEDPIAGAEVGGLAEKFAHDRDGVADPRVFARGPDLVHPLLDCVRVRGLGLGGHARSSSFFARVSRMVAWARAERICQRARLPL